MDTISSYLNSTYCASCQGQCCKSCGCFYYPEDIDLTLDNIISLLNEGDTSISTMINFKYKSFLKKEIEFMLLLRARNQNRGPIDILSLPTSCVLLTENGCKYPISKRPSGGIHFIPCYKKELCHYDEEHFSRMTEWQKYQQILKVAIFQMTGLSFEEKLKEDIEQYFYTFLNKDFDGVDPSNLLEHKIMILPTLERMYPHLKGKTHENKSLIRQRVPK